MFAKIFEQIFSSSIAEDYQVRHGFMDLLVLADVDGVVDMTVEAISRRTNVPLETVRRYIAELERTDSRSRSPEEGGARIKLIDSHRDWGWQIINFEHYRSLKDEEARRAYFRDCKREQRRRKARSKMSNSVQRRPQKSTQAEAEAEADTNRERERRPRKRGTPATVEEVIAAGAQAIPNPIPEEVCRAFWSHYEAIAREGPNGETFWVTGGENPSVISNWREKLKEWRPAAANAPSNPPKVSAARRGQNI